MLGADLVLDMMVADDFALLESQQEFIERYRAAEEGGNKNKSLPMLASSCPGMRQWFVLWLHFSAVFTGQCNRTGFCHVCGQEPHFSKDILVTY